MCFYRLEYDFCRNSSTRAANPGITFRDTEPCARTPVRRGCKSQLDQFGGRTYFSKVKSELCTCFYLLEHKICQTSGIRAAKTSNHCSGPKIPKFWQIVGLNFLTTEMYTPDGAKVPASLHRKLTIYFSYAKCPKFAINRRTTATLLLMLPSFRTFRTSCENPHGITSEQ